MAMAAGTATVPATVAKKPAESGVADPQGTINWSKWASGAEQEDEAEAVQDS